MSKYEFFANIDNSAKINPMPGVETKILSGFADDKMMMVLSTVDPGVTVPTHAHPHEQIGIVYSGSAKMNIGDERRTVREKDIYRIPSEIKHGAICIGDEPFVVFEVFCPIRKDFIDML